jgi:hypothetical protein
MFLQARMHLTTHSLCDSSITKSMSWLGLRSAESAAPLYFTRASYNAQPFNTWPGAAPAACYGTLDDYDDLDEAPWALRFGVEPAIEPAAPRYVCFMLALSAEFACLTRGSTLSMAACMNADRAQLEKILFNLNSRLPAADTVCITLVNGYVGLSVAAGCHGLSRGAQTHSFCRRW